MDRLAPQDLPFLAGLIAGLVLIGVLILWRPAPVRRALIRYRVPGSIAVAMGWVAIGLSRVVDGLRTGMPTLLIGIAFGAAQWRAAWRKRPR